MNEIRTLYAKLTAWNIDEIEKTNMYVSISIPNNPTILDIDVTLYYELNGSKRDTTINVYVDDAFEVVTAEIQKIAKWVETWDLSGGRSDGKNNSN